VRDGDRVLMKGVFFRETSAYIHLCIESGSQSPSNSIAPKPVHSGVFKNPFPLGHKDSNYFAGF
jgi:hypothetical protein